VWSKPSKFDGLKKNHALCRKDEDVEKRRKADEYKVDAMMKTIGEVVPTDKSVG